MFFQISILVLMLEGKKVLVGITGSIAAYKTPLLVRQLIKEGAEVKIIMTQAAGDFVSSLTLSTLSRSPVLKDLFDETAWANHVALGRWADLMVVAPLSCHSLSKMAHGQCDNLLMATYLSATCPVVVAPAMDEDMWKHGSTKTNLQHIKNRGCMVIPVEYGELASGLTGHGRMAEPETIVSWISEYFTAKKQMTGKKILITAGPTYEALDPVRFIGNHSSGKMGFALAEELANRGATVVLISGPVSIEKRSAAIELIRVTSAQEMYDCCLKNLDYDIAIMAAAVADYKPAEVATQKIKKQSDEMMVRLKRTDDILGTLGKHKKDVQLLVGFALETENEKENALKKLAEKGADLIVMNSLRESEAGFGKDTNKISIFYKTGSQKEFEAKPKHLVAKDIVDAIIEAL